MKYATLAMVATVAASTAAPADFAVAAHAAKCVPFTKLEVNALHATNLSKSARAAAINLLKKDAKALTADTATEANALATCWKGTSPPTVEKDQVAPKLSTSPCATEWNTW
jgi:hypothetical protein